MPSIDVTSSALAPGVSPVRVDYRDAGAGRPIVILHGGWFRVELAVDTGARNVAQGSGEAVQGSEKAVQGFSPAKT